MTTEEVDIAVIGAGAAGLSATSAATEFGARVALIDDNDQPGGQYFRQLPRGFTSTRQAKPNKDSQRFALLQDIVHHPLVSYRNNATVWDIVDPLTLAVADAEHSTRIRAKAIVIASGARDRSVAFPGWTLPGIITAGGLQNLVKGMGIVPPGPVVVAGNGPLLLVAAASLVKAGVKVKAVVEASNHPWRTMQEIVNLALAPSILKLAFEYRQAIRQAGTPILHGHVVTAAYGNGDGNLHAVDIAPLDREGNIIHDKKHQTAVQTLVTGFGLTPSMELARLVGAKEIDMPQRGGANIKLDSEFMTSIPGIFSAGDGASIGGVELALVEGNTAGIYASHYIGKKESIHTKRLLSRNLHSHSRLCRFRAALENVYDTNIDWLELLTPETIVCRCEDVALRELIRTRDNGFIIATQVKSATRIGMGRCQGRNCLTTLTGVLAKWQGIQPSEVFMPRTRQPARPILISNLLHEDIPPAEIPDDPHLPRKR